jgi:hypothetical protein
LNHVHSYPVAASLALLGSFVLSACSSSTPSALGTGAAGTPGAGAPSVTGGVGGTSGSAGAAVAGSVAAGGGGAGNMGGAGAGGANVGGTSGAGGASGGASGSSGAGGASGGASGASGSSGAGGGSGAGGQSGAGGAAAVGQTAAMIKATCPMYTGGTKAFAAADFCTLFQATCSNYIDYEPLTGCAAGPSLWAASYNGWTPSQQDCRSQHLCAAAAGSPSSECHSAQGFGGKCM